MLKYSFGGGPKKIEGFTNVDGLFWDGVTDHIQNLTETPYRFAKENSADEIIAIEVLEHISFKDTKKVLSEWYRILKSGGKMTIQVPDCGKAMEYYVNNEICECVPHKGAKEDFIANPKCFNCGGKGKIHPNRWLYSFTGAAKHRYDHHLNIFTKDRLKDALKEANCASFTIKQEAYKLIAEIIKI